MKVLGHSWVAVKAFPNGEKRDKLVVGAVLPEMMFYVANNPFTYEEIHEGGDVVLRWAKTVAPRWIDLARGMMTHSVKYGVDFFNELDWLRLLGYDQNADREFDGQVAQALGVDLQTAKVRVHNILDLALEVYLTQKHPEIKDWLAQAFERIPAGDIASVLAQAFGKLEAQDKAAQAITELKEKISPQTLTGIYGVARMWCRFSQALPEQQVEEEGVVKVVGMALEKIKGKEQSFINQVVERTRTHVYEAAGI